MKRLLSVLLSLFMMLAMPINFVYSTKVDPRKPSGESKSLNIYNYNVMNNENKNENKNGNKNENTSNGGGSSMFGQIAKVGAFVGGSALVGKFVFGGSLLASAAAGWKAHKLTTTVGEKFYTLTKNITGKAINSIKDYWGNLTHSNNQNETDQTLGQNGSQDSQTNAETEGGTRFNWGNFSLTAGLLWFNTQIRMLISNFRMTSIDQTDPFYQSIVVL